MPRAEFIADFVTHYYRASRAPFLNLSDLPDDQVTAVMADLIRERREGAHKRPFGRTYIEMRRVVEDRLRRQFTARGGRPERHAPHYFVLGESPWFRGLAADMEEIRIPLSGLPPAQTTVTWGDSFATTGTTRDFGLAFTPRPYYGRVYQLEDIPGLAARHGIPAPKPEHYEGLATADTPETFIEIQLLSDEPVRAYLPQA